MENWANEDVLFNYSDKFYSILSRCFSETKALVKESVQHQFNEYKKALNDLHNVKSEIIVHEERLNKLKKEVEKHEKANAKDMPEVYINKFLKNVTGFLVPGDRVWGTRSKCDDVECKKCGGSGVVVINYEGTAEKFKCNECDGRGSVVIYHYEAEEKVVNSIDLSLHFDCDGVRLWKADTISLAGSSYNCRASEVFKTKAEAEAEAKRRSEKSKELAKSKKERL